MPKAGVGVEDIHGHRGDEDRKVRSERELFRRRITMLLSPNSTVVFLCCFEQLEMAIARRRSASLTERLHLLR
jgi:hypothetical protein